MRNSENEIDTEHSTIEVEDEQRGRIVSYPAHLGPDDLYNVQVELIGRRASRDVRTTVILPRAAFGDVFPNYVDRTNFPTEEDLIYVRPLEITANSGRDLRKLLARLNRSTHSSHFLLGFLEVEEQCVYPDVPDMDLHEFDNHPVSMRVDINVPPFQ